MTLWFTTLGLELGFDLRCPIKTAVIGPQETSIDFPAGKDSRHTVVNETLGK